MRKAFRSHFHVNQFGDKVGVFTGADFCAEHEWGIKRLRAYFGMDDKAIGVAQRTNTKGIEVTHLEIYKPRKGDPLAYLVVGQVVDYARPENKFQSAKEYWKNAYPTDESGAGQLSCEWDEACFRIGVKGKDGVEVLTRIYSAIQDKKCYVALGGQGVFNNGGLNIIPVDDIPEDQKKLIEQADLDRIKLKEASEATGIEAKLRATQKNQSFTAEWPESGCKWFALSPRWANDSEKKKTKYPVVYWLNPYSQDVINFGWFTVEELEQWAQGKGPCVKQFKKV